MQVHQRLSILFFRKTAKKDKEGFIPIYCRVTIDGMQDEISTGCKVLFDNWDIETKKVLPTDPSYKAHNKKLDHMKTDIDRHFDLVVAKQGLATPQQVLASYQTPINGNQQKAENTENGNFSLDLDAVIKDYAKLSYQLEKLEQLVYKPQAQVEKLNEEKELLLEEVKALVKRGQKIFDDKNWSKTLILAADEFLLNFLQLVIADKRAINTLKKKSGTKKRLQEFLQTRFQKEDIPLALIEYKFITEFAKNEILTYQSGQNTIWKYVQIINEIMDRAVDNGWVLNNVFANYQCKYVEPDDQVWPSMKEMLHLIAFQFKDQELSDYRYVFVYQSFAGPSYAELYALRESHLVTEDGKTWVDQRRRKSKSRESLPLLPICLEIIERFRNHPHCHRTGKLLPVPTDQHYNRVLKRIGEIADIPCLNNSHQARYFFANEVAFANCKDLKLTGMLMGQRNERSVKAYVKQFKAVVSETMSLVEEKLYSKNGPLSINKPTEADCKIISLSDYNRKTQL